MTPTLNTWWRKLAARERLAVALAATTVALALLWWVALAPALGTLRNAPAQHTRLDAELQHLQSLATQAQALQAQPAVGRDEALRALQAATERHLGKGAQVQATGDQATATFASAQAEALAQWLADVRLNARLTPAQMRWSVVSAGVWQGSTVFVLPR